MKSVLDAIVKAPQLKPLTHDEMQQILEKIVRFHAKAYDWQPNVKLQELLERVDKSGYLLRSKIRSAIEYLDQLYLYQTEEESLVGELEEGHYEEETEEESPPTFEQLFDD